MTAKLTDEEFAARSRASAKRRAERQRQRKIATGKVQVGHWLTVEAKAHLDALAAKLQLSPSEIMTAAILAFHPDPIPSSVEISNAAPATIVAPQEPLSHTRSFSNLKKASPIATDKKKGVVRIGINLLRKISGIEDKSKS